MRNTRAMIVAVLLAASAWAEPGASTRPVQAPEPEVAGPGWSAPVVMAKDNYEAKLSWFPAGPKPGDLVLYRLEIKIPGGGAPTLLVKTTVSKTAPGAVMEAKPKSEVPPEATPQDGRYVFSQPIFVPGTYQVAVDVDDLDAGKSLRFEFAPMTVGSTTSNALPYGIGIAGLALIVVILAFGLRRPAGE